MSSPGSEPLPSERGAGRCRFDVRADDAAFLAMLEDDVRRGLARRPRSIPPKYFYDEAGSQLFERITRLPEYYLTRVEEALLEGVAADVVAPGGPRHAVGLGPRPGPQGGRVLHPARAPPRPPPRPGGFRPVGPGPPGA